MQWTLQSSREVSESPITLSFEFKCHCVVTNVSYAPDHKFMLWYFWELNNTNVYILVFVWYLQSDACASYVH